MTRLEKLQREYEEAAAEYDRITRAAYGPGFTPHTARKAESARRRMEALKRRLDKEASR